MPYSTAALQAETHEVWYNRHIRPLRRALDNAVRDKHVPLAKRRDCCFWLLWQNIMETADSAEDLRVSALTGADAELTLERLARRFFLLGEACQTIPASLRETVSRVKLLGFSNHALLSEADEFAAAIWSACASLGTLANSSLAVIKDSPEMPASELFGHGGGISQIYEQASKEYRRWDKRLGFAEMGDKPDPADAGYTVVYMPSVSDINAFLDAAQPSDKLSLEAVVRLVADHFGLDLRNSKVKQDVESVVLHWGVPAEQRDWE